MTMEVINSVHNNEVKHVVALHNKKERVISKEFIAEGIRACFTLLKSEIKLKKFYCTSTFYQQHYQELESFSVTLVSNAVMNKISTSHTPSGIVGIFDMPDNSLADWTTSGLVLAQISDPGNAGTLIRTAAALKIPTVVCIESVDLWSPKVVQSSAGTIGMVNIKQCSWQDLLTHIPSSSLYALTVTNGQDPYNTTLTNSYIVVGSEAHGIPEEWLSSCQHKITLPMPGNTESLNAAVAGSIALYLSFYKNSF